MSASTAALAWDGERDRLVGIAYRMLGDYGEAEDVVGDVAIEALRAESVGGVRSWPAWLTTACVRRSIDRLRLLQRRREDYPGPWLPEPVATERLPDDVVADRELLSIALLHLAEQLTPEARAAVVLHRAFAMTAIEIAPILDRTPAAVRQLISRGERRLQIDRASAPQVATSAAALVALVTAIESGDVSAAAAILSDDAVLWTDGGGRVRSALNPVFGPERIIRFFDGILQKARDGADRVTARVIDVNGEQALSIVLHGQPDVLAFEFRAGVVCGVRRIANPDKLARSF